MTPFNGLIYLSGGVFVLSAILCLLTSSRKKLLYGMIFSTLSLGSLIWLIRGDQLAIVLIFPFLILDFGIYVFSAGFMLPKIRQSDLLIGRGFWAFIATVVVFLFCGFEYFIWTNKSSLFAVNTGIKGYSLDHWVLAIPLLLVFVGSAVGALLMVRSGKGDNDRIV